MAEEFGVRATDRPYLGDVRAIVVENECLRVTFLPDYGCDIIELRFKPSDQSSLPGAHESGGRLLQLSAEGRLETDLLAVVYNAVRVRHISRDGQVVPES